MKIQINTPISFSLDILELEERYLPSFFARLHIKKLSPTRTASNVSLEYACEDWFEIAEFLAFIDQLTGDDSTARLNSMDGRFSFTISISSGIFEFCIQHQDIMRDEEIVLNISTGNMEPQHYQLLKTQLREFAEMYLSGYQDNGQTMQQRLTFTPPALPHPSALTPASAP